MEILINLLKNINEPMCNDSTYIFLINELNVAIKKIKKNMSDEQIEVFHQKYQSLKYNTDSFVVQNLYEHYQLQNLNNIISNKILVNLIIKFLLLKKYYDSSEKLSNFLNTIPEMSRFGSEFESGFDSGFDSGSNFHYKFMDLPEIIKNLINKINNNYNPYENINNIFENIYKNYWDVTLDNLSLIDKETPLFVNNNYDSTSYTMNIPHINNFIKNQTGGNQYEKLGIKITKIKSASRKSTNYLSTSLFDKNLNKIANNLTKFKNINHYSICLYESIILYLEYLPNYNIRIYGDATINIENNKNENIIKLFKIINSDNRIDYYEIEQNLNNIKLLEKDNLNHIGLFGALFRFYILLDPEVERCICIDADNFPMESFTDIIKNWEVESNNNLLIFKPTFYSRKNINDKCVEQLLAGMSGFKKPINKIINPLIFKKIFEYLDIQYNKFKDKYNDYCDNNVSIEYKTPFQFGFEEQALTNILIPFFIHNKQKIIIIPMYFDFGNGFQFYYYELLNYLSDDYKQIIKNKLNLDFTNITALCYATPLYSFNLSIGVILINFIDKCLKNNKYEINGKQIFKNISDIDKIKRHLSIKGFYHLYPAFNLNITIDEINNQINDLYNNTNKYNNLKIIQLTKEALHEFNKNTESIYQNYTNKELELTKFLEDNSLLDVLKNSNLYKKKKYLKYKEKYLKLKNQ